METCRILDKSPLSSSCLGNNLKAQRLVTSNIYQKYFQIFCPYVSFIAHDFPRVKLHYILANPLHSKSIIWSYIYLLQRLITMRHYLPFTFLMEFVAIYCDPYIANILLKYRVEMSRSFIWITFVLKSVLKMEKSKVIVTKCIL